MSKILVIEDEPNLQELLKTNLVASGFQVLVAPNGETGLGLAEQERPDLVLLDLRLPGISGWEVLSVIKGTPNLQDTPVIIMTASPLPGGVERTSTLGVFGYLPKPFSIEELLRQVRLAVKD